MQEEKNKKQNKTKRQIDDNVIYIGTKPFPNYVMAVFTQIVEKKHEEIKVIARGKFISKAVDVVELTKKRLLESENKVEVKNITIGSEKFTKTDEKGKEKIINVSVIEITLVRKE